MSDPPAAYRAAVEAIASGREVALIDELARKAVSNERDFRVRIAALQPSNTPADLDPVEEFLQEKHCEEVFSAGLAIVAFGSSRSHAALAQALAHIGRAALPAEGHGWVEYLNAGFPVVGRMIWGLTAQALAAGCPTFLPVLNEIALPASNDPRRLTIVASDRRLRWAATLKDADRTHEHYKEWMNSLDWLGGCSPYLAARHEYWLAVADLLLCLAGIRQGGHAFYSACAATSEPVLGVVRYVEAHPVEVAALLDVEAADVQLEVRRLWADVQRPGHAFDRIEIDHLFAS